MLLIGTAISLVTAVFATRAMLGLLAGFSWFDRPALHGRDRASRARSGCKSTSSGGAGPGSRSRCVVGRDHRSARSGCGPQSRDRLQGRDAGHLRHAAGAARRAGAERRASIDSSLGNAQISGRGPRRTGSTRASRCERSRSRPRAASSKLGLESELQATTTARRTSRRASAARSLRSAILAIIFSLVLIVLYLAIRST